MRKIILVVALLTALGVDAQEAEVVTVDRKDEIKLNALYLILGALEVSYERTINEESGVGISLFTSVAPEIDLNYAITPYYRYYFGEKPAAGFFMEGFGMLNSFDEYYYEYDSIASELREDTVVDFALGIGLGGKWASKKGVTFEISGGLGRNLFNNDNGRDYSIVGRGGLSVGYRF